MLCCAGLIGGLYIGQSLGGPWTVIAPAAGFGIGLIADMKFMHKTHNRPRRKSAKREPEPVTADGKSKTAVIPVSE